MSGFVSEPPRSDENGLATGRYGNTGLTQGQRHDRLEAGNSNGDIMADADNVSQDISAAQKMLSAISGSLLTSLLGRS